MKRPRTTTYFRCDVCQREVSRIGAHVEPHTWTHGVDGGRWKWVRVEYADGHVWHAGMDSLGVPLDPWGGVP